MVVRNHQIDPQALQIGNLFLGGNAVIDRHDRLGASKLVNAVERRAKDRSPRQKRCGINGVTSAPNVRSASVNRQVDVMPSTSKSPKTAMCSWLRIARSTRSATTDMPG